VTKQTLHWGASLVALTLFLTMIPPGRTGSAQGGSRTFPETGKTVKGTFLEYWNAHGGLPQQGFPISEEMQEKSSTDGKVYTVQYFERAVFEMHPNNHPPYEVLLTLLGTLAYKEKYPAGRASGEVTLPPGSPQKQCSPTHDDSDAGVTVGFDPAAPERETVGKGHLLTGRVLSSDGCASIAGVKLEMRPEIAGSHPESQRATLHTDAAGRYHFESEHPEHIHIRVSAHGFKGIITNQYHPAPGAMQGSFDIVLVPDPACRQFKETGQSLCGDFLDYWEKHGGLPQQGFPISDEFQEKSSLNGKVYTVQYFERAVFEHHPENQPLYDVLLSQLGTFRYRAKYPPAGRITDTIPLPGVPVKIALGGGFVWVATMDGNGGGSLARIDPAMVRIVGAPEPIGFEPHDLSFGEGGVWVSQQETVARFDPATGKLKARIPITVYSNYVPILAAEGSVWVTDPAEEVSIVMRIDPATNKIVGQPIKVGQEPLFLVAGGGSIWVGSHDSKTVSHIDPRSNQVVATIDTGFEVHGLTYAEGSLWIANYHGHSVARVDTSSNRVSGKPALVGYSFEAISAGGGMVWTAPDRFANDAVKGSDKITRIDARTGEVYGVLHTGGTPADVKVGAAEVWVAITKPDSLLRVVP
jgi:YVTN family beta-propeller protein